MSMAIGKSHRIVIEVEPEFKEKMYEALRLKGTTLKSWFTDKVTEELLNDAVSASPQDKKGGGQ